MRGPLKIAVIGCGDIAQKSYLPGLAGSFKGLARVVSVCDADRGRARLVAGRYRIPAFGDAAQMFKAVPSDVALVLTPLLTHAAVGTLAVRAGRHVYTEKPFALTLSQADAVIRLAPGGHRRAEMVQPRQERLDRRFRGVSFHPAVPGEAALAGS